MSSEVSDLAENTSEVQHDAASPRQQRFSASDVASSSLQNGSQHVCPAQYQSDIFWYMAWQRLQLLNYSHMMYSRCLALSIQNGGLISHLRYSQEQNQAMRGPLLQSSGTSANLPPSPEGPTGMLKYQLLQLLHDALANLLCKGEYLWQAISIQRYSYFSCQDCIHVFKNFSWIDRFLLTCCVKSAHN